MMGTLGHGDSHFFCDALGGLAHVTIHARAEGDVGVDAAIAG